MSDWEAMTLRNGEILCKVVLEMGEGTVHALGDVVLSSTFDLNRFMGAMRPVRVCQELARRERSG